MSNPPLRTEDLGAFLLKQRKLSGQQLAECLQAWNQSRAEGQARTLHELLVQRGVISLPGLRQLLEPKGLILSTCPSCGRARVGGNKMDWCAECHKPFEPCELGSIVEEPIQASTPAGKPRSNTASLPGYEIVRELGRGGMGEVVLAKQLATGDDVAIKFLSLDLRGSQVPFKRFAREGRVLANLIHPNLVRTLDVNLTSDPPYIVMEYVAGQTLEQRLNQRGYDVAEALGWVCDAIRGVGVVHEQGIIHRDLKPANILIDECSGRAKVTDFGLAKVMDSNSMLTRTGQSIGTPAYMAPEQILGEVKLIGPATDIYALGVMLYRVLCGRLPYEGLTMPEVLRRSLRDDVPEPESSFYRITPGLAAVCRKATRHRIEDRYTSTASFLNDLERAVAGESPEPSAAPIPRKERRPSRVARNDMQTKARGCGKTVAVLSILAIMLFLAGSVCFSRRLL